MPHLAVSLTDCPARPGLESGTARGWLQDDMNLGPVDEMGSNFSLLFGVADFSLHMAPQCFLCVCNHLIPDDTARLWYLMKI
ncbi:hypothetical protein [Herbaspirillum sp. C9C3]|uniref:hypothetical protein n=1 Tax=Herbaspirillum sp. C9C3 TaxID=2735271 RepID=UPI0015847DBE|nr:hypothetical protein [Herbaspirillum sp. C9C3]NUT62964.1 hypothetical protein [Herbaspirillum sp. C9C3]